MRSTHPTRQSVVVLGSALALMFMAVTTGFAAGSHTTTTFSGVKVNGGTVTHKSENGKMTLTLSDDFKVPDSPAPHWQVVDSKGNTYLLNRLVINPPPPGPEPGDKFNQTITLPSYIKDVAKVQIWCAWVEVLLGEAAFKSPVM